MRTRTTCCFFALLCGAAALSAPEPARAEDDETRREYRIEKGPLGRALNQLAIQSHTQILYEPQLVEGYAVPSIVGESTLGEALSVLLHGTGINAHHVNDNTIVLRRVEATQGSEAEEPATKDRAVGALTGRVTSQGEAVAGVTVTATSTGAEGRERSRVATTNEQGTYSLRDVPPGTYSVRFELEGLVPVTQKVQVLGGETTTLNITMELKPVEEEIVVTGSRIRRAEVEGPSPVIFINREDLDRTGRATVAEALATLPQNFAPPMQRGDSSLIAARVDLRGLGSDNTLVLVNGRRVANSGFGPSSAIRFVDLNSIPLSAVERIEVLTDGASAVYGSDAVAGVVNIILKEDFRGTEVSVNYGASSEGGASERRVSFTTGGARSGLRGLLTGEYFNRGRLAATDRTFSRSNDQRARGGRDLRSTFTNPGNVLSLDGQNLPGLDAPSAGIPAGQDGRNLMPADFVATAGQLNREDLFSFADIVASSERWGLSGRLDWDVRPELALFAEASLAHTTNEPNSFPSPLNVIVPANNPFNPFGQDVLVQWLATELGTQATRSETDNLGALLGLEGRLGQRWVWENSLRYSRNELEVPDVSSSFDFGVVAELLNRTDPATALNVFGDGAGANTPAVLEELTQGSIRSATEGLSDLLSWDGQLNGVLARLAGRELRAAVGAEFRDESIDHTVESIFPSPGLPPGTETTAGDREVVAGFAEFSFPLFDPEHQRRGVRALELQLAGRWESYSDFGETFNPRFAVRWQPLASLALRGSWGTGFQAPDLQQLFFTIVEIPGFPVVDPRRNNEIAFVLAGFGGNPDLEPEDSENWNVGLVWDVPGTKGLSLTADWYTLEQDNRVANGFFLLDQFDEDLETTFPERYRRAEPTPDDITAGRPGVLLEVDARDLNVSTVKAQGLDLGVSYLKDTVVGRFDLRLNAAYIDRLEQQLTPLTPVEQVAGTTGGGVAFSGSPVRLRGNAALFWSRGAWEVGVTERYTGAPRESRAVSPLFGQRYDDHFETDLQVTYRLPDRGGTLAGTRLSVGVENVFNQEPPFQDESLGYDGTLHSPRQRFAYLTLTKAFGAGSVAPGADAQR